MTDPTRATSDSWRWPVATATHAGRDAIGAAPSGSVLWPGMLRFIGWAARTGFDGIDLSDSVVPFDRSGVGKLGDLFAAVRDNGLRFGGLNLLRCSLADPHYGLENVDRIRRSIDACAELDAGIVNISLALPRAVDDCNRYRGLDHARGGSLQGTDSDFEVTAERLRELAGEARKASVALSIELHHASLADSGAATLRLHNLTADKAVGVNPDLVNGYWSYCTPLEDWRQQLRMLAPLTNIWHVKNVQRVETETGARAEYLGTSLGDGDVDYHWACRTMRDAGFSGWVSIERGGAGDALRTMGQSLDYLNDLMSEMNIEGNG